MRIFVSHYLFLAITLHTHSFAEMKEERLLCVACGNSGERKKGSVIGKGSVLQATLSEKSQLTYSIAYTKRVT